MKELLITFGFSESEAELYVALLKLGEATVDECVKICNVRRTTAYSIMKRLHERGLVAEIAGKPIRFCPLPPDKTLRNIVTEQVEKTKHLSEMMPLLGQKLVEEANSVFMQPPQPIDSEPELMIVRGVSTIDNIINQCLGQVQSTIRNIIRWPLTVVFGKPVSKEIEENRARKIEKRMIFEDAVLRLPDVASDCAEYIKNEIVVKHLPSAPAKLLIFDNSASLTVIRQNQYPDSITSLFSRNKELIALQIAAFDALWEKAENLTIRKIEELSKVV